MNWEQRFCVNQACATQGWIVHPHPTICDVWWVSAHLGEHPFTIAATVPVCRCCGTTLPTPLELGDRHVPHIGAEVGSVFDFVRSLP
jgi:hypothetical protein